MKKAISVLASLKLTVGLLVVLLGVLAAGTIIESMRSADAARVVYRSPVFFFLLGVFVLNLLASLIDRWPYGRYRIGYVITHASIIVILTGALTTEFAKVEGRIALWEGEQTDTVAVTGGDGSSSDFKLPFAVRLDAFEIDVYPGTQQPAMFRSRVTIVDPSADVEQPAVIQMNDELSYGGYKFFQSSYRIQGKREASILSVAKDPGRPIVFLGYVLLMVGMLVVFSTRIVQRHEGEPPAQEIVEGGSPVRAAVLVLICVGALAGVASPVAASSVPEARAVETLRTLAVQHDGRVMPLDTLAREAVWKVTGMNRWVRQDPVATVLGWTFSAQEWAAAPIVKIGDAELAEAIGMSPRMRFGPFDECVGSQTLRNIVEEAHRMSQADRPLTPIQENALELERRLVLMRGFLVRESIRPLPVSEDPVDRWAVPEGMASAADLVALKERLEANPPTHYPSQREMVREVRYSLSSGIRDGGVLAHVVDS